MCLSCCRLASRRSRVLWWRTNDAVVDKNLIIIVSGVVVGGVAVPVPSSSASATFDAAASWCKGQWVAGSGWWWALRMSCRGCCLLLRYCYCRAMSLCSIICFESVGFLGEKVA